VKYAYGCSALLLASLALVAQASRPTPNDSKAWHITPGGSVGVINSQMTEDSLINAWGKKNVTWGDAYVGEGMTVPGTILFANNPQRRLEIIWKDNERRRAPDQAQIDGEKSLWKTTRDITLGTSLKELERINGKPFVLSGFDTDYDGTVHSWRGGVLEREFCGNNVVLRLAPAKTQHTAKQDFDAVLGDSEYSSDNPAMQRINPVVYEITWVFK